MSNGLSCEIIKRQPKVSFHRHFKSSDHCYIGNFGRMPGLEKTYMEKTTGCIGEIIAFRETLDDQKPSYIHEYLIKKWRIADTVIS